MASVVHPARFRLNEDSEEFVRTIDGGRQELSIPLWDYNPLFRFSLCLGIRIDSVEEITNRFSGSPPEYHSITLTSITQLEFLGLHAKPGGPVEYRAESQAELAEVLPDVCMMVRERVLPFFDEYRDIGALNRGLNPEGAEQILQLAWPTNRQAFDATTQPYRAMAGVAVAFLASDPRLKGLVAAYRAQLSEMAEEDRIKYDQMVAYLLGT